MDQSEISNAYKNRTTLAVYYSISGSVLIAGLFYLVRGDFASALSTALIFLLMFVPSILKERYRLYLPFTIHFGLVLFIFLTLFLGELGRFYERVPFWDKFLHFQSGLLLGATGYVFVYILNEHKSWKLDLSPGFVSVFAVTFSLAIGAVWEMVEFTADNFFHTTMQLGNADTMWDLIADGGGALIISVAGYFWMHRYKRLPFTPWMLRMRKRFKNKSQEQ